MNRRQAVNAQMARGMDTQAMLAVFAAIAEVLSMLFLNWFSVPEMKYSAWISKATLFGMAELENGIAQQYGVPQDAVRAALSGVGAIRILAVIGILLAAVFAVCAVRFRVRAAWLGRIAFAWNGLLPVWCLIWVTDINRTLNLLAGRENSFLNLSKYSTAQRPLRPMPRCSPVCCWSCS